MVQVMPGRICLLETSFEGRPEGAHLVTSNGISIPYQDIDNMGTRAGTIGSNYRFVMPDEDVFCNEE